MIRINLLPRPERRAPRGSRRALAILGILVLAELGAIGGWYVHRHGQLAAIQKQLAHRRAEVDKLNRIKQKMQARDREKEALEKQRAVFDALRADQVGPHRALLFLSFALTSPSSEGSNDKLLGALEQARWKTAWDPHRLALTSFQEKDKKLVIEGEALDPTDVAEFLQRLRTSVYFYDVVPDVMRAKKDETLGIDVISFKLKAKLFYPPLAESTADAPGGV